MKNITIVFISIAILSVAITVSVSPQKRGNPPHRQIIIQEKKMAGKPGQQPYHSEILQLELFPGQKKLPATWKAGGKGGARQTEYLSDTTFVQTVEIYEEWDFNTSVWNVRGKHTYVNDTDGNRKEDLYQIWGDSDLVNSRRDIYGYGASGKITEDICQVWDGYLWLNESRQSYAYDTDGKCTEWLTQNWSGSTWINFKKHIYTYDVVGNQVADQYKIWNGHEFVTSSRNTCTYDENDNRTEELFQMWNGSVWIDKWKTTYTYNELHQQTVKLHQIWDGSFWIISGTGTYSYDESGNLAEYTFVGESTWKYTYAYDADGNITGEIDQVWNGGSWMNASQYIYTYDGNGNRTEELLQGWNGTSWVNYRKYTYTWLMLFTDMCEEANAINSFALSTNYPNPFNPSTNISYTIPKESNVTLKIFDVLGREVAILVNEKEQQGEYHVIWSAQSLPSGVYFYRLVAGDYVQTKKMVLMK